MRTNVELDDALVEEAFRLTPIRTNKELLHLALQALIKVQKKRNLLDLSGQIQFAPDFDPAALHRDRPFPQDTSNHVAG